MFNLSSSLPDKQKAVSVFSTINSKQKYSMSKLKNKVTLEVKELG